MIIDAKQIGEWGLQNPKCLTTVLHELVHVLYEERHLDRLGEKNTPPMPIRRSDGWTATPHPFLDEFDVDRVVDTLVRGLARKDDGSPWSLRELDEAQGIDWVQSLMNSINQVPSFIEEKLWQFQTRQVGIDEIATVVIPAMKTFQIAEPYRFEIQMH